jgi:hypothetical protein
MDLDGRNATDFRLSMRAALIAIAVALLAGLSGTCMAGKSDGTGIGQAVRRREDLRLVTGQGCYKT